MQICVKKRHIESGTVDLKRPSLRLSSVGGAKNKVGNCVPALHSLSTADQWLTTLVTKFITSSPTLFSRHNSPNCDLTNHSTVTLFAKLRGLSTSVPFTNAT
jgi:hypothetical protein